MVNNSEAFKNSKGKIQKVKFKKVRSKIPFFAFRIHPFELKLTSFLLQAF